MPQSRSITKCVRNLQPFYHFRCRSLGSSSLGGPQPVLYAREYAIACYHPPSMRVADLAVIAAYLLFITWFGAQFKKSQKTLKDYFLGGRGAPWWAIAFSIVSAETSTLTVIRTPAISCSGNIG